MVVPPIVEKKLWELYKIRPKLFDRRNFFMIEIKSILLSGLVGVSISLISVIGMFVAIPIFMLSKEYFTKKYVKKLMKEGGINVEAMEREGWHEYNEVFEQIIEKISEQKERNREKALVRRLEKVAVNRRR